MSDNDTAAAQRRAHVDALKAERRGYEARGLDDRVREVDAELERFGAAPVARSEKPVDPKPTRRRTRREG